MTLRFDHLRTINVARCVEDWHHSLEAWSRDDWIVATAGELGEAGNLLKKLNRDRDGLIGNNLPAATLRAELADELADTVIYLDLLAAREGLALGPTALFSELTRTAEILPHLSSSPSAHFAVAFRALARATAELQSAEWYAERKDAQNVTRHRDAAAACLNETVTRLAACANSFGIDLGTAVVSKFNRTSAKHGFSHRLVPA